MRKKGSGEIVKISKLFEVYAKRFTAPEKSVIKVFTEVVEELYGVSIGGAQCSYKPATRTILLTVPGTLKSEILLHKNEVLAHITGRLGQKSAPKEIL